MNYCNKCNVTIVGERRLCPLCQNEVQKLDSDQREVFPPIPTVYRTHHLFFRILTFASVVLSAIAVLVNLMLPSTYFWSLFVVAGVGCVWISLSIVIVKRKNLHKNLSWQVFFVCVLAVLWDVCTGWRGWSIDFVIPIACIAAMISMGILALVLRMRPEDYLGHLLLVGLFGIVPLVFYFTGIVHIVYPSLVCVIGSVTSLVALMVFQGEKMYGELKRRLHF